MYLLEGILLRRKEMTLIDIVMRVPLSSLKAKLEMSLELLEDDYDDYIRDLTLANDENDRSW